jgi:hypothetical protein
VASSPFYQNSYQISCADEFLAHNPLWIGVEIENPYVGGSILGSASSFPSQILVVNLKSYVKAIAYCVNK